MKKILTLLVIIVYITGCKKDNDNNDERFLKLNMKYQSDGKKAFINKGLEKSNSDTLYTQFGDHITSISPTVFIGKFLDMRLQNWHNGGTIWNYGFNIIDNNVPEYAPTRLANFSSNATVNFNLASNSIPASGNSIYNIFVIITMFFYQEFELPTQYNSVAHLPFLDFGNNNILNSFDGQWIGGNRTGLTIKGGSDPFLAPVFDSTWAGFNGHFPQIPKNIVFGSTDTTYLYYSSNSGQNAQSIDNPLGQSGYIIRSSSFNNITIPSTANDETKTVSGTMTFDSQNLIQIYAGADNIPYTWDDIFVYAPKFWERFSVFMTVN